MKLQNWQISYKPHTENVLLATTSDHGETWNKVLLSILLSFDLLTSFLSGILNL
jgi:hypothetical protein